MASPEFAAWWAQFAMTGEIAPLRLGDSQERVREVLGEPDDTGGGSRRHTEPAIWRYERLEFHFDRTHGHALFLIYRDRPDGLVEICIQRMDR